MRGQRTAACPSTTSRAARGFPLRGAPWDQVRTFAIGIQARPTPQLHVTLWGGVSILRSVAVLDRTGVIVNERNVEPAGLIGGTIALGP